MPCYFPLHALNKPSESGGKGKILFLSRIASHKVKKFIAAGWKPIPLPCGRCVGCRLERSQKWAIRLMKEARCHERNSFLTLTYEKCPLTKKGLETLVLKDVQDFMKRLRFHFEPRRLRFFLCGEYGERSGRPHYHVILFGEDFIKDRVRIEDTPAGFPQYMSETLTEIWGLGRATIGNVDFESAAYVARYALKKVSGPEADVHYQDKKPEFVTMSRRPGLGSAYFQEFVDEIYLDDSVPTGIGRPRSKPPRYYDKLLEKNDPELMKKVKKKRQEGLDYYSDPDSTDSRLAERERVKQAIIKTALSRRLK